MYQVLSSLTTTITMERVCTREANNKKTKPHTHTQQNDLNQYHIVVVVKTDKSADCHTRE